MQDTNHSHLDIKCDNILLDGFLNVKIADFGFAKIDDGNLRSTAGSWFHRAPEIVKVNEQGNHPYHPYNG